MYLIKARRDCLDRDSGPFYGSNMTDMRGSTLAWLGEWNRSAFLDDGYFWKITWLIQLERRGYEVP